MMAADPVSSLACLLPGDVMLEILSCLPIKSLMKFKSVKKAWHSLVTNPFFIKKHKDHCSKHSYIVVGFNDNDTEIGIMDPEFTKWEAVGIQIPNSMVLIVGSLKGLICLTPTKLQYGYGNEFWLINPATRDLKFINRSELINRRKEKIIKRTSPGFGFDQKNGDFKIVVVERLKKESGIRYSMINIYSLNADSWRTIETSENIKLSKHCMAAQLGSSLYWISKIDPGKLIGFDLCNEMFYTVPLPESNCLYIMRWEEDDSIICIYETEYDNAYCIWKATLGENMNPEILPSWVKDPYFPFLKFKEKISRTGIPDYRDGTTDMRTYKGSLALPRGPTFG